MKREALLDDFVAALKYLCPGDEIRIERPEKGRALIFNQALPPIRFLFLPASVKEEKEQAGIPSEGVSVWEDQWIRHREVILGRLAALTGQAKRHYARLTVIKRVSRPEAMRFLEENHLLVPVPGKYRYGIYSVRRDAHLLSLAVFSGARELAGMRQIPGRKHRSFELLRFCAYRGHLVTGGLSKLLSAFIRDFQPDDIMTYIDLDWSGGISFKKLGFREEGSVAPQLFWIRPGERVRYYPHRLPVHLQGKSIAALHRAGYYRIYNSGSMKMRLTL